MRYFTADTHFYHINILAYENRPFKDVNEMNNAIIHNWNKKVQGKDEVYILGDFAFCSGAQANELLDKLNGKKYLIKGNHDSFIKDRDFDHSKFEWIKDYAVLKENDKKIVLFHYPIAVWDCQHYDSIHLYGHVHSNTGTKHPLLFKLTNAYNVGVDVCGFEPKSLSEIIDLSRNKCTNEVNEQN